MRHRSPLWRGFLTAFLNPKGLLMYLAVLPQFVDASGNVAVQSIILSSAFIATGAIAYTVIGLVAARSARIGAASRTRARVAEAIGGTLLGAAALRLSAN